MLTVKRDFFRESQLLTAEFVYSFVRCQFFSAQYLKIHVEWNLTGMNGFNHFLNSGFFDCENEMLSFHPFKITDLGL